MLSLPTTILFSALAAQTALGATGYTHSERRSSRLAKRWHSTNPQVTVEGSVCTVKPLGGGRDDGPALLYAMNELCSNEALINLPGYYTVDTVLNTKMKNVEINLGGAISYTPHINYWNASSIFLTYQNATTYWFLEGHGVTLHGGGTITANAQAWWEYYAVNRNRGVAGGSSTTFARPIPLTVGNSTNVLVKDISVIEAPFWSNMVFQSMDVTYDNIQIRSVSYNDSAPAANSDGWDIYRSSHVTIKNSNVQNGDDCVSFKPNTTFATVDNMLCNGSHGISIGSLGQYAGETDIVSDIYVNNIHLIDSENGARIKVFGGSPDPESISGGGTGYVRNVTYTNMVNDNSDRPIYITQCYMTDAAVCKDYPATLEISDVHFSNISGTTSGVRFTNGTVVSLECSATCRDITATDIELTPFNGTTRYQCRNIADESLLEFPCSPF